MPASVREIARVLRERRVSLRRGARRLDIHRPGYRWLGRGGGHVNPFTDADAVARMFTEATGLRHAGTRVLCTSLSFLNRRNIASRPPRRLLLFCNGDEGFVRALTFALRCIDRWFHRRASVYGWAFFFGDAIAAGSGRMVERVCRCGSGVAFGSRTQQVTRRRFLPDVYICPRCGTRISSPTIVSCST